MLLEEIKNVKESIQHDDKQISFKTFGRVLKLTLKTKPNNPEEWQALGQKFPNLSVLIAKFIELTNGDMNHLIANFPQLKVLKLFCNSIGPKAAKAIAESAHMQNLKFLNLGFNKIGVEGAAALKGSEFMQKFKFPCAAWISYISMNIDQLH